MAIATTLAYYRVALFYYVVGGLTFVPLCVALLFGWFFLFAPVYDPDERKGQVNTAEEPLGDVDLSEERKREALDIAVTNAEAQRQAESQKEHDERIGSSTVPPAAKPLKAPPRVPQAKPHRSGWLVVRRQFQSEDASTAASQQVASGQEAVSASVVDGTGQPAVVREGEKGPGYMSSLYKGMLKYSSRPGRGKDLARTKTADSTAGSGASTPDSGIDDKGGSKRASDRTGPPPGSSNSRQGTGTGGRESFYCILKGPVLYLYSSDDTSNSTTECHAAIDLRSKRVSLYISGVGDTIGEPDEQGLEQRAKEKEAADTAMDPESSAVSEAETAGEARVNLNWKKAKRATVRDGELFTKRNAVRIVSMAPSYRSDEKRRYAQWFIFCRSATTLEDWYHSLLHASMAEEDPVGPAFSPMDMVSLLGSLDTLPDPIPLRWLNALVGRVFFSIYRTAWLEDYVTRKIMKKISRVRTPGFLSDIRVQEVDLGRIPPAFSRPMLKSLTGDGEASMEVAIHYTGRLRLTISTILTISLGSRFKPYNVPLVLAVIINSLEGNLLLQIKPPPSNRIWFGFTKLPNMDISVEPVVSERKVQWGMVKKLIEGRIRELLTESLVVPNMDDISFFDSRPLAHRGGIWSDASKRPDKADATSAVHASTNETPLEQKSKSTPASVLDVAMDNGEERGATSALRPENKADMKRRKPAEVVGEGDDAEGSGLSVSPAAAGLSTLLARDMARDQNTNGKDEEKSAPSSSSNRRSWFVGRSSTIMPPTSQGTDLATAAASSAIESRKKSNQQSSLAWGNASLSMPTSNETAEVSKSAPVSSIESPGHDALLLSASPSRSVHGKTDSISSVGTLGTSSVASADTEELHAKLTAALERQAELDEDDVKTPMTEMPTVSVHDSQGSVLTKPGGSDDGTAIPVSLSPDQRSIDEEARAVEAKPTADVARSSTILPPPPPRRTPSHGFAPPPMRGATVRRQQPGSVSPAEDSSRASVASSAAAAHLSALQRDRYGFSNRSAGVQDDAASTTSANSSSATFLNTWNKAKASMADKDSRQVAAREAKDALKRGWASWNAKRAGPAVEGNGQLGQMQMPTSSDQLGEASSGRSRTSSWLASSPEDPASLGVGFDVKAGSSSPLPPLDLDDDSAQNPSLRGRQASESNASSRASSVSGRGAYREHRANKEKSQQTKMSKEATPSANPSEVWDASVPSLATPMAAAKREPSQPFPRDSQKSALSASPSSIRKWSAASSSSNPANDSEQSSTAYSFAPSQGQATIGLSRADLAAELLDHPKVTPERISTGADQAGNKTVDVGTTSGLAASKPDEKEARRLSSASTSGTKGIVPPVLPSSTSRNSSPSYHESGIKQQPTRATMMAIPGIPSIQKTGPQSFSAAPEPARETNADSQKGGLASSPRLGLTNLISRMPSFGTSNAAAPGIVEAPAPMPNAPNPPQMAASAGEGPKEQIPTTRDEAAPLPSEESVQVPQATEEKVPETLAEEGTGLQAQAAPDIQEEKQATSEDKA